MKIYTKTGDKGLTSLIGGKRVPKYDLRIEAYGTVDELNSHLGLLINMSIDQAATDLCREVQSRLFDIGSNLAMSPEKNTRNSCIQPSSVEILEQHIDRMNSELPDLRNFILPGSSESNAQAHICRTVCRRAERRVVELAASEWVDEGIIVFLNRFSDYLFVLSRWIGFQAGHPEIIWKP